MGESILLLMHGAERTRSSSLAPEEHLESDVVHLLLAVSAFAVAVPAPNPQPFTHMAGDLQRDGTDPLSPRRTDSFSGLI